MQKNIVWNYHAVILNRGPGNIYGYQNIKTLKLKGEKSLIHGYTKSGRRHASQAISPVYIWDIEKSLCNNSAFELQLNKHVPDRPPDHGKPLLEQGGSVRRKEQQTAVIRWLPLAILSPLYSQGLDGRW